MPDKPPRWLLITTVIITVCLLPTGLPGIIGLGYCYYRMKEYTQHPGRWLFKMIGAGMALLVLIVVALILLWCLMLSRQHGSGWQ